MDMFGFPEYLMGLLHMDLTAIGYSPMRGGHGFLIIHGDGRLFIMVAGFTNPIMGGYGFLITNGAPDGSPGEDLKVIMGGRP